jgi:PHS family inorganic phosphate transporter-like MFS transporter
MFWFVLVRVSSMPTSFVYRVAFFNHNLSQKDFFSAIGWIPPAKTINEIQEVYRIARARTLIALWSTVLGYWSQWL